VTSAGFSVAGHSPESIQTYDEDTLTRLLTIDFSDTHIVDIASDGRHCVFALLERDGTYEVTQIGPGGHRIAFAKFERIRDAKAFVYLRNARRFVVLADGNDKSPRLYWFSEKGRQPLFSFPVGAMRGCFVANKLGTDSRDRVFLAGVENQGYGRAYVVSFDGDGNSLGDVPLDSLDLPVTGITANRNALFVTGPRGVVRFDVVDVVPEGSQPASFTVMTPMLFSPDREDQRRWLRIEATTTLPMGSTLEISWAATNKPPRKQNPIIKDDPPRAAESLSAALEDPEPERGRVVFQGAAATGEQDVAKPYGAALFDVHKRYVQVFIKLTAPIGARLPALSELNVFYPGRTLMENLPSIYQRDESQPNSFLRSLVGVLETTTQGIDSSIRAMGSNIHPATAPETWLDFIARWLGLPWDDALSFDQKRAVVGNAAQLAKARGTRLGLETLLESLIPGQPRRFRVTDTAADFGFAIVGGRSCTGSKLPAMLGGYTRWRPELDSRAVLGYMRLPCPGQIEDGAWQLAGTVLVEVAATAAERKVWEAWLLSLISAMVPLTARVELRWVAARTLRTDRLDDTLTIEPELLPHLGTDAITDLARLPESGTRLTTTGASIGKRLR
jgi:phage tail-like protein